MLGSNVGFDEGSNEGSNVGLMWFEEFDKNNKNLLVVVLSLLRRSCWCFVCLRM